MQTISIIRRSVGYSAVVATLLAVATASIAFRYVTLEGPGTIDGQGFQFHSPVRGAKPPSGLGGNSRPYHLLAYRCEGLIVRNIDLLDCAYHSLRVIQSKRVHMDSIYIHNRVNGNNDGFHFISTQYLIISNCIVLSQDDACALFLFFESGVG